MYSYFLFKFDGSSSQAVSGRRTSNPSDDLLSGEKLSYRFRNVAATACVAYPSMRHMTNERKFEAI